MPKKGFTLIELLVVIAIIGLLAFMVSSFDFNKKTDAEKRDRFVEKIGSILQSSKIAMMSGKGIKVGPDIINPSSIRLVFSCGAIITNYYSGTDVVGVGESLTGPFFGESGYNFGNFYYVNKDSSTGAVLNPFSIIYDSNGDISFSGSDAGIDDSVMIKMDIGFRASKNIIKFDRRYGKFLVDRSIVETGSLASASAPVCITGSTWDGTNCVLMFVPTQIYTCAAKPAIGTIWNTVSSYTQSWDGSTWFPASSTTSYDTTASVSACNYICDTSNYTFDGTNCIAIPPVAPTTAGSVRCGAGSATVTAIPPSGSTVDWYTAASGGTPVATGMNSYTPSVSSTTTYYAESRNTTTSAKSATRTAAVLQVDALPVAGTATWVTQHVCVGANMTMNLSGQSGTINRWQYSYNGGAWVDWGYAGSTSVNWGTAASGWSNYSFRAVVTSVGCAETYSAPTGNSIVDDQTVGGTMTAGPNPVNYATNTTLAISGQVGAVQQWEYYYSAWTPWAVGTPTSVVWTAYPGYYFRALIKNGVCPAVYSSQVYVTVTNTYKWVATANFALWGSYWGAVNCVRNDGVIMKSGFASGCSSAFTVGQEVTGCASGYHSVSIWGPAITCP